MDPATLVLGFDGYPCIIDKTSHRSQSVDSVTRSVVAVTDTSNATVLGYGLMDHAFNIARAAEVSADKDGFAMLLLN